jgi:hypothetical protein
MGIFSENSMIEIWTLFAGPGYYLFWEGSRKRGKCRLVKRLDRFS